MRNFRLLTFLFLITTLSFGQNRVFDLNEIKFKGLDFSIDKGEIIKAFGAGEKKDTDYECGFFTNDQEGGPYYQLVYKNFNYIGSDKERFYLQNVNFDLKGIIELEYQEKVFTGRTTKDDVIEIFGDDLKNKIKKYQDTETLLLYSKDSDDGALFTFKNGRLIRFEYWTPC